MYTYMGYHTVYIAKAVESRFKGESNKSGLLNDLLLRHYSSAPSSLQKHHPERREVTREPIKTKLDAEEAVKEVFPDVKPIESVTYKKTSSWGA